MACVPQRLISYFNHLNKDIQHVRDAFLLAADDDLPPRLQIEWTEDAGLSGPGIVYYLDAADAAFDRYWLMNRSLPLAPLPPVLQTVQQTGFLPPRPQAK